MQTFLPHSDFAKSAAVLDRQRLGKQRVETLQIMRTLAGLTTGWANHPAVRQWRGHETTLLLYQLAVTQEWKRRGYVDTCWEKTVALVPPLASCPMPPWLGCEAYHASHRSNLLRKNPQHYRQFWPDVAADLPYVWPG